jgi:hypothetical protein
LSADGGGEKTDNRFTTGDVADVVHMTVKPQDVIDDEQAIKSGPPGRAEDGSVRGRGCRCVVM